MNLQNVLNATAQIAGGSASSVKPGLYKGAGGITGVLAAYALYQEAPSIAEDGPVHVSFFDGLQVNPPGTSAGPDQDVYKIRLRMQLMISYLRSDVPTAMSKLTPFLPLYITAFNANLTLKGTCNVSMLEVNASPGIVQALYPDRMALELYLSAVIKEAVGRAT